MIKCFPVWNMWKYLFPPFESGIKVKISPSTEVTEGDRVKLTCSTSCPLTNNKNYIWYLNDQLLQLPEYQNKHLVLDVVTTQHAGNYSCAVNSQRDVRSPEKTLRVQRSSLKWTLAAAAGAGAALLVFTSLVVIWIMWVKMVTFNARNVSFVWYCILTQCLLVENQKKQVFHSTFRTWNIRQHWDGKHNIMLVKYFQLSLKTPSSHVSNCITSDFRLKTLNCIWIRS